MIPDSTNWIWKITFEDPQKKVMLILGERCLLYNSWGLVWGKILAVDWTLTLMRLMVYSFQIGVTTENEPCFQESMAALRAWWLNFFKHPIQITGENVKLELYGFIIWRYPPLHDKPDKPRLQQIGGGYVRFRFIWTWRKMHTQTGFNVLIRVFLDYYNPS